MFLILALLPERLKQQREAFDAEVGTPDHLTRHAIDKQDGQLGFLFDTANGPRRDGAAELLDVAVIPGSDGAMLVMSQPFTDKLGEVQADDIHDIGAGIHDTYAGYGDVKFSALGDPELDESPVFFYEKDGDKYEAKDVTAKIQGFTIDGDKAIAYANGQVILLDTDQLLQNLRDDTVSIDDGAIQVEQIGDKAKMARACAIEIGGETKKVWAYTQKSEDGEETNIFFLDKDTLKIVATQKFDGNYATPSYDGKQLIMVGRTVEGADETYRVTRRTMGAELEKGSPTP